MSKRPNATRPELIGLAIGTVIVLAIWAFSVFTKPAPEPSKYVPPKTTYASATEDCLNRAHVLAPSLTHEQRVAECARIVEELYGPKLPR